MIVKCKLVYIAWSPAPTVASAAKDAVGNIDLAKIQQVKDTVDSFTTEESKKDD